VAAAMANKASLMFFFKFLRTGFLVLNCNHELHIFRAALHSAFGTVVGRVANRIGNGSFVLDGKTMIPVSGTPYDLGSPGPGRHPDGRWRSQADGGVL
jgi:hypothetical protein